jgi:serine/threonine protein kinase
MHQLNITHNDIKPANIVYSPKFKKLVFIDFGLSQINLQKIG